MRASEKEDAPSKAQRAKPQKVLTKEQAERMASDLDGYDGKIQGGRLVNG